MIIFLGAWNLPAIRWRNVIGAGTVAATVWASGIPAHAAPSPMPTPSSAPVPSTARAPSATPAAGPPATSPAVPRGASQISAAQTTAQQASHQVTQAQAHVATQLGLVRRLSDASQRADAAYQAQVAVESRAKAASTAARADALRAQATYAAAKRNLVTVIAARYLSGGSLAYTGELLAADNPSDLVDTAAMQLQLSSYQALVETRALAAHTVNARAAAARRAALSAAVSATAAVRRAQNEAARLYADARRALVRLRRQLLEARATQKQADAVLSSFVGGWSLADPQRAAGLNQSYTTLADRARNTPMAPAGTRWTAAMGQSVVNRALQSLGTPYAWDGGSASAPTVGVCAAGAAGNDCHVVGFDCSGLALYSWAPYVVLPHNAASQYSSAGRVHPGLAQLLPGDLVFWSSDGTTGGIHHVAIYVGSGNVVQAPASGDVVRITPLGDVSSGYFGATRPLS